MHKAETRGGDDLLDSDIEKILEIEYYETTLLKWEYDPASGGTQTPSLWRDMVHQTWQHDDACRNDMVGTQPLACLSERT